LTSLSLIVFCGPRLAHREAQDSAAESLVRTLSAFVGAAVRGLVRDAILAGPPGINLSFIADHAGCACVEAKTEADGLGRALALSRVGHLLIVRAGYIPQAGFAEAIEDLLRFSKADARGWLLRGMAERPLEKILPHLAQPAGLLAPRALCLDVKTPTFANLVRATHARPAARLTLRRVV
jgi:hypothetical protein